MIVSSAGEFTVKSVSDCGRVVLANKKVFERVIERLTSEMLRVCVKEQLSEVEKVRDCLLGFDVESEEFWEGLAVCTNYGIETDIVPSGNRFYDEMFVILSVICGAVQEFHLGGVDEITIVPPAEDFVH